MTNVVPRLSRLLLVLAPVLWMIVGTAASDAAPFQIQPEDPVGVYAYVSRVELEPATGEPERLRVWGSLSVAVPGDPGSYHVPEVGHLYFELPPGDPAAAVREWRELMRLGAPGFRQRNRNGALIRGKVAFGRRGAHVRVRTMDEAAGEPDVYLAGNGVSLVPLYTPPPGARQFWSAPKPMSRIHYALVDRVVLEPATGPPERMQVWGSFVLGQDAGSYAERQRGYLYLTLPRDRRSAHEIWSSAAGTGHVLKFFFVKYHRLDLRLRPTDEAPQAPDAYTPIWDDVYRVRSDSAYAPIQSLLSLH